MSLSTANLISVIVPIYNVEEYLERCVDSILAQDHKDIELILVDDGSPDRCGEMCDTYAAQDSRVTVIHQQNAGLSGARNSGLRIAHGEFVLFVDSDDYIDSDMCSTLIKKAYETGADIVECNLHHTYQNSEDTEIVEKYFDKHALLCMGRCIVWNKLYRRSILLKADAWFPLGLYYEDLEFYAKLIPHINRYEYVDIAPYHYVQRSNSINNFSTTKTMQIFQILKNITDYYKDNGFYAEYEEALEFLYTRILLCSSFLRMCGIKDAAQRKTALLQNWSTLVNAFPKWRKNRILKIQKSHQAIYMRTVGKATYRLYSLIFPAVRSIKNKINRGIGVYL